MESIEKRLLECRDETYKSFQGSLIPSVDGPNIIGVRTPVLRSLAKEYKDTPEAEIFMRELPHKWFEENQLHAFLISEIKDYDKCMEELEVFLPYVDNWATCDQMNPKVLKKKPDELHDAIKIWISSKEEYTVRFGIKCLMNFYLDDLFDIKYLEEVASVNRDEYYIKMMVAWYFATALAKQYDASIKFLEDHRLVEWTHRKTIQKARESYRVSKENKEYLKTLL